MIPIPKRPTVEILYEVFSKQEYKQRLFSCLPAEFIPSYDTKKNSFIEDELYIKQKKEFVLTTIGAPNKN